MDSSPGPESFYERFWQDADYQLSYALHSAVRDRFPAIQKVWGAMLPPRRVLDFGCGNGALAYWMHCHGFGSQIVGVDVSVTAVQFAQRQFARPGLSFHALSTTDGLTGLGVFDVTIASHVLEHLEKPEEALVEMASLTEWLVLEVPLENCWVPRLNAALRSRHPATNPVGHVQFWTRESFRALVALSGLIVIRDFQYASAPFSRYQSRVKRLVERAALGLLGVPAYGRFLATHYAVLARSRAAGGRARSER
jgi:SAM-dependent methyltransferase